MQSKFPLLHSQLQHLNALCQSHSFLSTFHFSLSCAAQFVAPSFLQFLLPLFSKSPEFLIIRCSLKSERHDGLQHTFDLTVTEFEEMMGELLKASVLLGSISKSNSSLEECEICFHNPPDVLLSCYHAFCAGCVAEIKQKQNSLCPYCRSEMIRRSSLVKNFELQEMEERVRARSSYVIVNPEQDAQELQRTIHKAVDRCYVFLMAKHPLFSNYF